MRKDNVLGICGDDSEVLWRSTYYLNWFFGLRCAGDVLNAVSPIGKQPAKEITEAVAVVRAVRRLLLAGAGQGAGTKAAFEGMRGWELIDLCSGNALVPVLAAHLFPLKWSWATDKRARKRPWQGVKRFTYHTAALDVSRYDFTLSGAMPTYGERFVVTAVHPCGQLAYHVVRHFLADALCRHLVLMPCCADGEHHSYGFLDAKLDGYDRWCLALCDMLADGGCVNVRAERDAHVLSPLNVVITASKLLSPELRAGLLASAANFNWVKSASRFEGAGVPAEVAA